jgi:biotin carboxyl carrier protein
MSRFRPWIARIQGPVGGPFTVESPAIGWWSEPPAAGAIVGPGSCIGKLRQLGSSAALQLPDDAPCGRVASSADGRRAVGYGEVLFSFDALGGAEGALRQPRAGPVLSGLPVGCLPVTAPTDGTFYRSPAPDDPPFVRPGDRVRKGAPIGLIEVMKTFNRIDYGAGELPEEAEVVEIRCDDGAEVAAGDTLLVVRAAG